MSSVPIAVPSFSNVPAARICAGPVENWPEYEAALLRRGDPEELFKWAMARLDRMEREHPTARTSQCQEQDRGGRTRVYPDALIRLVLFAQAWTGRSLRHTLSFCESMSRLLGITLEWPDHSTVSRRARQLGAKGLLRADLKTGRRTAAGEAYHADTGVDSTGLSARSPGLHRMGRRANGEVLVRTPVRSSVFVDLATSEILSCTVSPPGEGDPSAVPRLLTEACLPMGALGRICADGAYDTATVYKAALEHGCHSVTIPPTIRECTKMKGNYWHKNTPGSAIRREAVNEILDHNRDLDRPINDTAGRAHWKKKSGYHRRSLVETAMSRLERVSHSRLSGRSMAAYVPRFDALCSLLNFNASCGMPVRERAWIPSV
jgi:Transposase DDE domain